MEPGITRILPHQLQRPPRDFILFIVVAPIRGNPDGNILGFTVDRELRSLVELAHNDVHLLIGAKTRAFQLLCRNSF